MLEVGTKAPEFSLPDQNGDIHTLEEYRGRKSFFIFTRRIIRRAVRNRLADIRSARRFLWKKGLWCLASVRTA